MLCSPEEEMRLQIPKRRVLHNEIVENVRNQISTIESLNVAFIDKL